MAKELKPKPTLTVSPVLTEHERHQQIFDDWFDECTSMQEAFIEGLLALMPSLDGKDG